MKGMFSLVFILILLACSRREPTVQLPTAARGRLIYQTQCTACHHADPKKSGALGPEVFGSSQALLEARLLKGNYPIGYTPKRPTHLMAPLPHLKEEIQSLTLFLNDPTPP